MSANKLLHKLSREVKRNPKRAGVLGLLVVVALWFWAPLILGWIIPEPDPATTQTIADDGTTTPDRSKDEAATTKVKTDDNTNTQKGAKDWKQLVEWIESDALTVATTGLATLRDPFTPVKQEATSAQAQLSAKAEELQKKLQQSPDITPQSVGLTLSSTIVGPHVRVALLNGRTYKQGQLIKVGTNEDKTGDGKTSIEFKLLDIQPEQVTLERSNKKYTLTITKQKNSGLFVIERPL